MMVMIVEICIGSILSTRQCANGSDTGINSRLADTVQTAACDTIVAYISDRLSNEATFRWAGRGFIVILYRLKIVTVSKSRCGKLSYWV